MEGVPAPGRRRDGKGSWRSLRMFGARLFLLHQPHTLLLACRQTSQVIGVDHNPLPPCVGQPAHPVAKNDAVQPQPLGVTSKVWLQEALQALHHPHVLISSSAQAAGAPKGWS